MSAVWLSIPWRMSSRVVPSPHQTNRRCLSHLVVMAFTCRTQRTMQKLPAAKLHVDFPRDLPVRGQMTGPQHCSGFQPNSASSEVP